MDPELFKDPEVFNPERFINANGQYEKSDHVHFFGFGKRRCVGEKLGRTEMFLFFSVLLQKFKFKKAHHDQVLDFTPKPGLAFHPKPFEVIVEPRQ